MARKKSTEQIIDDPSPDAALLAALATPAPPVAVTADAIRAALAVVSHAIRAEAQHQWDTAVSNPDRAARVRLSIALSSIAARIEAAAPAGTPAAQS